MLEAFSQGDLTAGAAVVLVAALLVALGFEFVNGFHDTANAVATVIYTKTLPPTPAVVLSGLCNFVGVFVGGIAVAMAIVHLLPVDLVVASGTGRGLAMIAALLLSAIAWNLGTWWLGLPASSSHTMIGAIMGVGIASSAMEGRPGEGVAWHEAGKVLGSLLLSPLLGLTMAAGLVLALRALLLRRQPGLFEAATRDAPPAWIRAILILTCSGVSFAHGSNDGQKGVGLVMLILVGVVPAGFALDLEASAVEVSAAREAAADVQVVLDGPRTAHCTAGATAPACVLLDHAREVSDVLASHEAVRDVPASERWRAREGAVYVDSALRALEGELSPDELERLRRDRAAIARLTEYAPTWVLVMVALALGVGTTVGWKRIVVTVGEKIGKSHLTYAQGASAELVAMLTVGLSSRFGLPVSTTHVLSSAIAGTMLAERAGVQGATVKKIAVAWVLTLPVTMLVSGVLFAIFATLAS